MRNAKGQLLVHYGSKDGFKKELKNVVNRSLTVSNFEKSWKKMLEKYNLEDNSHLKTMYEKRADWVPAYFRGTFFANMSTSQRSKGMNADLKLLVDNHTFIYRFVLQLEKVVEGIWQKESDEDCRTMNETPQLCSRNNMEVEACRVYTRRIFSLFKKELLESSNGVVVEVERERFYEVKITCHPFFPNWVPETHKVCIDRANDTVSCSCKGYEFVGFLCAHAMKVMQHIGMQNLPCKYIIKRWTKGANESIKRSLREISIDMDESIKLESMRYETIYPKYLEIVKLATKSRQAYKFADGVLDEMKARMLSMILSIDCAQGGDATNAQPIDDMILYQENTSPIEEYIDPLLSQCKGRKRKPQRMKPMVEKNAPKRRTCSYCNKQEGRDFRSCQKRKDDLAKGKKKREADDNFNVDFSPKEKE